MIGVLSFFAILKLISYFYSYQDLSNVLILHLFDKCEGLRQVLVKNIGYFILQDTDASYSDTDTKRMSAFSAEYAIASKKDKYYELIADRLKFTAGGFYATGGLIIKF